MRTGFYVDNQLAIKKVQLKYAKTIGCMDFVAIFVLILM